MADIGPVIVEQLKSQGIDSSYSQPPDFFDRFGPGDWNASLFGHGGSVRGDPYDTLALYQSKSVAVPGQHGVNFSRWHNAGFDKIVDEMAATSPDSQDKIMDQWLRALALWLPELPDIPIQEWYHRIPMNQTYWTGWPTKQTLTSTARSGTSRSNSCSTTSKQPNRNRCFRPPAMWPGG